MNVQSSQLYLNVGLYYPDNDSATLFRGKSGFSVAAGDVSRGDGGFSFGEGDVSLGTGEPSFDAGEAPFVERDIAPGERDINLI